MVEMIVFGLADPFGAIGGLVALYSLNNIFG
jgi:hypothetical protein